MQPNPIQMNTQQMRMLRSKLLLIKKEEYKSKYINSNMEKEEVPNAPTEEDLQIELPRPIQAPTFSVPGW